MLGSLTRVPPIAWYMRMLRTYPYRTNGTTAAILMGIGDGIAQRREARQNSPRKPLRLVTLVQPNSILNNGFTIDLPRTLVMSTWAGIMGTFWTRAFRALDHRFQHTPKIPGVLAKVSIAALLIAPITNGLFLSIVTTAEVTLDSPHPTPALVFSRVQKKLHDEWWNTFVASCSFWPACNLINWMFLPQHMRVLFGGLMSTVWNVYLSLVQHRESDQEAQLQSCSPSSSRKPTHTRVDVSACIMSSNHCEDEKKDVEDQVE
eukprot:m.73599 g.73599  ORF g.73599 m.73599 type:complete len:261 (-) comp12370_c0_seq8:2612-3394(-)